MFSDFFSDLENKFNKKLPGIEAQKLLSPSIRNPGSDFIEENDSTKSSAILLLIYPISQELHIAFIKRQTYNGAHSGQISFPGGKCEKIDTCLQDTALRESNEEIGININDVKIIGQLTSLFIPISNITVFPFVGITSKEQIFTIDKKEVVDIIKVKISDLLDSKNYKRENIIENGFDVDVPYFDANSNHIWGATAMILSEFIEILKQKY